MKFKITLIILGIFAQSMFAQVEFTARVSKNKLALNQRLRVEFTVNKQGADNFTPPDFKNFEVLGGPSQSISQSWINGRSSYSQTYSYIIAPVRKGNLVIGSATIEYDDKNIKSNTVEIEVLDAVEMPKDPNDPDYIANQNVHLEVIISNTNPYVGQGIYVEYRMYFSHNIGLSDFDVDEFPELEGFWNQEIKLDELRVENGKYKGEDYRYFTIKKAILIPQKSGKLSLKPLKTNLIVAVPTGRGDFFGNAITHNIRKSFQTYEKTIQVKPLPTQGKPDNFAGAVGDFSLKVSSSKPRLKANESTQLKVAISGRGNFKLFELPVLETPKELEVYAPERKENIKVNTEGLQGLKGEVIDEYTLVPQYKGKYKIPLVEFSYFNPSDQKYHTLKSEDLFIEVSEGKEYPNSENFVGGNKQEVGGDENSFRYLETKSNWQPKNPEDFYKSNLFYWLLFLPMLAIPVAIVVGKKQKERANDLIGNRTRKADKLARKYLSQAQKQLGKKEAFYIALEKALHNYLKAKLHIETSENSKERITELLQEKQVDEATIKEFISVLNDCDFARYSPVTSGMMNEEFDKAKQVIIKLDKQL